MKRLLLTLTVIFSLFTLSSFADTITVTTPVLNSFNSSFKHATEVNWTVTRGIYKANFLMNGQYVSAFYDVDGKMVAVTRNITSFQLPLSLQTEIKNSYDQYWISDLFEIADEQGTSYYVTLESADSKLILKSEGSNWTTYQKQRKS
ncbi:MAG TPA: hypothetical protein VGC75_04105 [Candidatus Nitrosocosmicus sp.]